MNPDCEHGGMQDIVDAARRHAPDGGPIVAFADSLYVDVLMNWLVALSKIRIDNYLIVALDTELHRFLRERGISAVLSPPIGSLSALWIRRIEVFAALCAAGIDFVHSDVDAIWMRDPRRRYLDHQTADLTFSQGTVWPPDVLQQQGFVLCCGLFRLRSTPRTRELLLDWQRDVIISGDDQVSINRLIVARSTRWQISPEDSYRVTGAGKQFLCARSVMRGRSADGLELAVLPHHLFQRVPVEAAEPPYVLHLLTRKDPIAKFAEFAKFGCLFLRSDWRSVDFDANSLDRLHV